MITTIQPKANVKSSSAFRKYVCPLLFGNIERAVYEILIKELEECDGFSVTCDHWTSKGQDSYQSLTVHYVNKDFELKHVSYN